MEGRTPAKSGVLFYMKKGDTMEQRFRIGEIANTHGIRGEVKVYPTTDDVARFKKLKKWLS